MNGPHDGGVILTTGAAMDRATTGAIFVHGRGADARDILGLAPLVDPGTVSFAAPEAAGGTWYPNGFMVPIEQNEPGISSGLGVIDSLRARFETAGVPAEKLLLLGFSQGACLALEYAARNARRFGGVVALSGGLIGPPGTPRDYSGSLDRTPVYLGCSDTDPHIPRERVEETADVMRRMGADVTLRLFPGLGHGINDEEIEAVRVMLKAIAES